MRVSVPSASYSSVYNVLRHWSISLIPTYRVYRLYDSCSSMEMKIWVQCMNNGTPKLVDSIEELPPII